MGSSQDLIADVASIAPIQKPTSTGSVMMCTATVIDNVRCPKHRVDVPRSCTGRQASGVDLCMLRRAR
jgi:hypothetical protein